MHGILVCLTLPQREEKIPDAKIFGHASKLSLNFKRAYNRHMDDLKCTELPLLPLGSDSSGE